MGESIDAGGSLSFLSEMCRTPPLRWSVSRGTGTGVSRRSRRRRRGLQRCRARCCIRCRVGESRTSQYHSLDDGGHGIIKLRKHAVRHNALDNRTCCNLVDLGVGDLRQGLGLGVLCMRLIYLALSLREGKSNMLCCVCRCRRSREGLRVVLVVTGLR